MEKLIKELKEAIENYTQKIQDQNNNLWEVIEVSVIEDVISEYVED